MRSSVYLIFDKNGFINSRKAEYSLKYGQIAIKINFELSNFLFKQPVLEGTIVVSDEDVRDKVITELEFELKRIKASDE